jgi:hypothetical protein
MTKQPPKRKVSMGIVLGSNKNRCIKQFGIFRNQLLICEVYVKLAEAFFARHLPGFSGARLMFPWDIPHTCKTFQGKYLPLPSID